MAAPDRPDLADVLAARARVAPYLRPTPLYGYSALGALTGARLRVKHENHQPATSAPLSSPRCGRTSPDRQT
jgi:threonine dehydratase